MTPAIEDVLEGKYEILEKIGEGGIGSVYKVRHRLLDEIRVIKILRPQAAAKEDHQERFLQEARMAIRLKHPNIAQLFDFSISEDGTAFIVMEFIDGIALDALLKASGAPSLDLTLEIAQQSLPALAYLHAHDLVHRDISPDNLMLTTAFGGGAQIKLIDLGIAKNLAEESSLTQTGVFLGKVRYCSPEQFSSAESSERQLDHRSDIYSFGLLLYELLTGAYPYGGQTFAELAGCHLFQPPIAFEKTDPEGKVPEGLRAVVLRAVEKDPDARFASADEFAAHLLPFRNVDRSIDEELNQTVERTISAIPHLDKYPSPGSTQDRLNAQFGLGTTTGPKTLAQIRPAGTTAAGCQAAAPSAPGAGSKRWLWGAAIAAVSVLTLAGIWLGRSILAPSEPAPPAGLAGVESAAGAASTGRPIEIAQTQRFGLSAPESADVVALDRAPEPPPSTEEKTVETKPAPQPLASGSPQQDHSGQSAGDRRQPPAPELRADRGSPPEPGVPEGAPVARTSETYDLGVGVVPPVLLKLAEPIYPDGNKPKNEIVVEIAVLVDENGNVLTAKVESGPRFKRGYRDEALAAAQRSIFRSATKDGVAGRT